MVHELPSVAGGTDGSDDLDAEARLLQADRLIAVSRHGRQILVDRGVEPGRIDVVPPGADRLPVHHDDHTDRSTQCQPGVIPPTRYLSERSEGSDRRYVVPWDHPPTPDPSFLGMT
jgi:hypothetical protein